MSSYTSILDDATSTYLDAVGQVGGIATTVVDAAKAVAGKLPVPAQPAALPTVSEVVTANFAVAQRLLAAQESFALKLAASLPTAPVVVPAPAKPAAAKAAASA